MKFYKIILSSRNEVIIDDEDFEKLKAGMNTGSFVKLKKAIVNPSFVQVVVPIDQKEAVESEIQPEKIEGFIDTDKDGKPVFRVTSRKPGIIPVKLTDEMNNNG